MLGMFGIVEDGDVLRVLLGNGGDGGRVSAGILHR